MLHIVTYVERKAIKLHLMYNFFRVILQICRKCRGKSIHATCCGGSGRSGETIGSEDPLRTLNSRLIGDTTGRLDLIELRELVRD